MDASMPGQHVYRIAVVEDDVNLAFLLRYNLEALGHVVMWISDGTAAWSGLSAAPPDAVVLDWGLPGLAGIEVLRRMRMTKSLREIPVLMLTARCLPEDRQRAFETGANAFLAKPFSVHEVVDTLHRLIAPPEPSRAMETAGAMT